MKITFEVDSKNESDTLLKLLNLSKAEALERANTAALQYLHKANLDKTLSDETKNLAIETINLMESYKWNNIL